MLDHGFYFSLGHGVGLDVHEAPSLGRTGHDPFSAGDVVTEDGCETLTDFPYELQPWLTR